MINGVFTNASQRAIIIKRYRYFTAEEQEDLCVDVV